MQKKLIFHIFGALFSFWNYRKKMRSKINVIDKRDSYKTQIEKHFCR